MTANWKTLHPGDWGASARFPGADANLCWADSSHFADFRRCGEPAPAAIPVLIELNAVPDVSGRPMIDLFRAEIDADADCSLPAAYSTVGGISPTYCTALLTRKFCQRLFDRSRPPGSLVTRFELQMPVVPQRPRPTEVHTRPPKSAQGRVLSRTPVLLGLIDNGCPFARVDLRSGGQSRILAIWDQDTDPAFNTPSAGGTTPPDFGYGCEVGRQQIEAMILSGTRDGVIAEDACYAAAGDVRLRGSFAHGAAVLDLLAGNIKLGARDDSDPRRIPTWKAANDVASRSDLVFVQVPRDGVQDSSSAGLPRSLLDGMRYIISCAGEATRQIVINVSDSSSRGTHDGSSLIERAFEELVKEQAAAGRGLKIVLAAGNNFDQRRHAVVDRLTPGSGVDLTVNLPESNETACFLFIRVPASASDLSIGLYPPGKTPAGSGATRAGMARSLTNVGGSAVSIVFPAQSGNLATLALVRWAPTVSGAADTGRAVAGHYRLRLESSRGLAEPIDLYIARNATNAGALPRNRQPTFVDVDHSYGIPGRLAESVDDPDSPASSIRRRGALSSLACGEAGKEIWVVGSYQIRPGAATGTCEPSAYSAAGPAAGRSPREGPDLSAPSDRGSDLVGVRTVGVRSGECAEAEGTSFAAPQVARALASGSDPQTKPPRRKGRNGRGNLSPF